MALTEESKEQLYIKYMRYASAHQDEFGDFVKSDLRSTIDQAETALTSCYVSFNNSLAANVKAGLTKKQKIKILVDVVNSVWEEDS